LESEAALSLTRLYHTGKLPLADLISKFTASPARLLRIKKGTLGLGADADVTVLDLEKEWVFQSDQTASKSKNSPFGGWPLKGQAVATIVGGKLVYNHLKTS
jgi:dihydroorotase